MTLKQPLALICALSVLAACSDGGNESRLMLRVKAVPQPRHRLTRADVERVIAVLRSRAEKLGVRSAEIKLEGPRRIAIGLPGVHNRRAAAVLTKTGLLEFYDFEALLAPRAAKNTIVVRCATCMRRRYVLEHTPALTGSDVNRASVKADFDPATGQPVVLMKFTARGSRAFAALTRRVVRRGPQQHVAIVVDDEIVSLPYIDAARNPNGISAASGVQINVASAAEAKQLVLVLETGALPVRLVRLP